MVALRSVSLHLGQFAATVLVTPWETAFRAGKSGMVTSSPLPDPWESAANQLPSASPCVVDSPMLIGTVAETGLGPMSIGVMIAPAAWYFATSWLHSACGRPASETATGLYCSAWFIAEIKVAGLAD